IMTSVPMRVQALVSAALLMLSACATPFQSNVSRSQQMPAPAGQSFVIHAADSSRSGSIQFSQYAAPVRQQLMAQGYATVPQPCAASLGVGVDYVVSGGRE